MWVRKLLALGFMGLSLSACSKGGDLVIEPGARPGKFKGASYVQVNQGGKALVVESGQTADTGVHGWVTIQPVSSRRVSSASETATFAKPTTPQ